MSSLTKIKQGITGRIGLQDRLSRALSGSSTLWFHVASSGEIEQSLPIMDAVKAQNPHEEIVLSYFSPSALNGILMETKRRLEAGATVPWTVADYSPFDFTRSVDRFLDIVRPRAATFIHREIWPGMVKCCVSRKIPVRLFAAHFPQTSARRWPYYGRLLSKFDFIGTTDDASASYLRSRLPDVMIERIGDPRVERVMARRRMRRQSPWASLFEGQQVLMLSSVWPKDFSVISEALSKALIRFPSWRVVVVPHEPHPKFESALFAWFKEKGLKARLWSQWLKSPDMASPIIVDAVGFLAELYEVASIVFVGGSFSSQVHNVLEPAAYGKPILTGPRIWNSVEACDLSGSDLGLRAVQTGEEFGRELLGLMESRELRESRSKNLLRYLEERGNAGQRYAQLLF